MQNARDPASQACVCVRAQAPALYYPAAAARPATPAPPPQCLLTPSIAILVAAYTLLSMEKWISMAFSQPAAVTFVWLVSVNCGHSPLLSCPAASPASSAHNAAAHRALAPAPPHRHPPRRIFAPPQRARRHRARAGSAGRARRVTQHPRALPLRLANGPPHHRPPSTVPANRQSTNTEEPCSTTIRLIFSSNASQ